jgi:uncharacterized protein
MRKTALAFCSFLLAGTVFAQQTPSSASTSTAPAKSSAPAGAQAAPAEPPGPTHPLTDAQAKEMLELSGALDIKQQLTHGVMNYFRSSMPFLPKDVSDDLEQSFDKLDFETPIIAIYKQHISTEDAVAIIAFYKTPAGKDMIQSMPTIMQQSQQVGLQLGRKTAQEVVERHRAEIEAAAKEYQQEHTPKSAPSLNTPNGTPAPTQSTPSTTKPDASAPGSTTQQPQ